MREIWVLENSKPENAVFEKAEYRNVSARKLSVSEIWVYGKRSVQKIECEKMQCLKKLCIYHLRNMSVCNYSWSHLFGHKHSAGHKEPFSWCKTDSLWTAERLWPNRWLQLKSQYESQLKFHFPMCSKSLSLSIVRPSGIILSLSIEICDFQVSVSVSVSKILISQSQSQ